MRPIASFAALLLAATLGGLAAVHFTAPDLSARADRRAAALPLEMVASPARAALPPEIAGQALPSLAPMLRTVTPAVVSIQSKHVVRVSNPLASDPFFRQFFGIPDMPQERVEQALGSGVVVDAQRGLILTNNHVVEAADGITVTLADGRTVEGQMVGADPGTDIALVRIHADGLSALKIADSNQLQVGDFVVAVGNPFGLGQTVTSGIVSALGRSGLQGLGYQNLIQTDASINPGNSGGALVNLRGELVGINRAIYSPTGSSVGIGFAIPSDLAQDVMHQLLANGKVVRGSLGVEAQDLNDRIVRGLRLASSRGALVSRVYPGSAAQAAGVQVGDVVTAVNGDPVVDSRALRNAEGLAPVGKPVVINVLRDGRALTLTASLKVQADKLAGGRVDARLQGATLDDLPDALKQKGLNGVIVSQVAPGSRAYANSLQAGDLIAQVNGADVRDLAALQAALAGKPTRLQLTLVRGQMVGTLSLQ
ncbi:MAG: Do family serine endopeptidase [Proteobacteria bacterium]|nr:Do family serine endopeptidase [Pseudomonadota bacterium]MBS0463331.1 Do family serine endopeptidase [Pseudomonadota bacterium]MBS0463848.1 Do family serine endopeptidase [Pseudomonadota bacterium]